MSKKAESKMLKVVYFDEGSALDYLDIFNGGIVQKSQMTGNTVETEAGANANVNIKTGIIFKAIKPFVDINVGGGLEAGISRLEESAVKATISNTILSDFIEISDKDSNIEKTTNFEISAFQDSITFMKMYTPYLNMIKMQDDSINFQKIDETLEKGKGYYELIASDEKGKIIILRFNIRAFRNNYNLVDLTKMNLTFYSVKVGKMDVDNLEAKKEFDLTKKAEMITSDEILTGKSTDQKSTAEVFDVILAGIKTHE